MKKFLITIFFTFSFFLFHSIVHAQVAYPINELGNCRDANECYLYCAIPQNTPACWSYGTYVLQKNVLGEKTTATITFPIPELDNCTNVTQCKAYCDIATNKDACMSFAKSHGMTKQETKNTNTSTTNKTLEDAHKELGCNSLAECKAYCKQHHDACMAFAKKHSLSQTNTTKKTGPGGCDSETSCKAYCSAHQDQCKGFAASNGGNKFTGSQKSGDYLGPGGCKTAVECKQYCTIHPSECPGFRDTQSTQKNPTSYPKPTP